MTAFLLSWKEGILFAMLIIFLFTPWSRSLRRYILLGLLIYLLNKPLIANFHPGEVRWWLGDPAAWITAATWLGAPALFVRWLQGIKGQGILSALSEVSWSTHLIAIALIPLALFFVNLPVISPHFKTQPDYSFAVLLTTVPLQYFIGFSLLKFHDETIKNPLVLSLINLLVCVLLVSLSYIPGTISEYRALLHIPPTRKGAAELLKSWEALLERNRVASIGSIRRTAYGRIGDLKLALGDVDGAQQSYQSALRENPEDMAAQIGIARIVLKKEGGITWKAKRAFQGVMEQNPSLAWEEPKNVFPPFQLRELIIWGDVLDEQGKQKEALNVYRQALQINPQDPWVNFRVGKIQLGQEDYEAAISAFKKTLAKLPNHLVSLSSLVDIYEEEGKMDLARQYRDVILKKVVTHRIRPSDWKSTNGGNLCTDGGCHARVTLYQGKVRFTIHARGAPAHRVWPHMLVKLNKEIIGEVDVTTREFKTYSFTKDVETGIYRISIVCTNNFSEEEKKTIKDRKLFVGAGEITYVR
jgi:tetratricopeptide (TPR) repeat protein